MRYLILQINQMQKPKTAEQLCLYFSFVRRSREIRHLGCVETVKLHASTPSCSMVAGQQNELGQDIFQRLSIHLFDL